MLSELVTTKLTRYFNVLDADKNGYIQEADFAAIARNLAEARGWAPGTPGYAAVEAGVMLIWRNSAAFADRNHDGQVTLEEWLAHEDYYLATPERWEEYGVLVTKGIFDVIDDDGDGSISPVEWRNFYQSFRIDPDAAADSFRRMDLDGDGSISRDEMVQHVTDFHFSDDPNAPGNWLFGPWQ